MQPQQPVSKPSLVAVWLFMVETPIFENDRHKGIFEKSIHFSYENHFRKDFYTSYFEKLMGGKKIYGNKLNKTIRTEWIFY